MSLLVAAAAICTAGASLCFAQDVASTGPAEQGYTQAQPAPIERAYPPQNRGAYGRAPYGQPMPALATLSPGSTVSATDMPMNANPVPGVFVRVGPNSSVKEMTLDSTHLELRVEAGIVNVNVHDPQKDLMLLVDLPGGQTQMLKNGLYTFNAATDTARVLKGEALAFPASNAKAEPMKVKEYNKIEFGKDSKPHEFVPQQAMADMIPAPQRGGEYGGGGMYGPPRAYGYAPYGGYGPYGGYAPYGDGYYGYPYPYYGFVEPWPWWGYPYGGFYPGIGIGFGYFGGWGFHGGGFHGRR